MASLMKVGELAKQTKLSIRTLHYYDEIGLLSPSHRNEIGHRLYSEQDIIRLQQILSLRQLGFSLKEVHECLESPDFSLPNVINLHRARLQEQVTLSHALLDRLNAIATDLETTQSVAVENLIEVMEAITMSEQYFTPEQQAVLEERFRQEETDWNDLLTKAKTEMSQGTDLNSHAVRSLAKQWLWSMKSLIGGDAKIYESMMRMYQQAGPEAASWGTMDSATFDYILKAVSFLSLAEYMDLRIDTAKIFTPETVQVIRLGKDAIRQIKFGVFGTEGMLLGLLAEGMSPAAEVLTAAGVTFEATRQSIMHILSEAVSSKGDRTGSQVPQQPAAQVMSKPAELPFAPRAKLVIELALEQAQQFGQSHIAPEHLLLAILQEGGGVATHVLQERFGLDLAHLEQQLRSVMSR